MGPKAAVIGETSTAAAGMSAAAATFPPSGVQTTCDTNGLSP